jgi:hypothetical protein
MGLFQFALVFLAVANALVAPHSLKHHHLCRDSSMVTIAGRLESLEKSGWTVVVQGNNGTVLSSSVVTDAGGAFSLSIKATDMMTVVTAKKNSNVLAAVVPPERSVVVNARTTVAVSFGFAQFLELSANYGVAIYGSDVGTNGAALVSALLADFSTGGESVHLAAEVNSNETTTRLKFRTLTERTVECSDNFSGSRCQSLLQSTARPNGMLSMARLAQSPGIQVSDMILSPENDDWTLPVVMTSLGQGVDNSGPGGIAFDHAGNIIMCVNYLPVTNGAFPAPYIGILDPAGVPLPSSPFYGQGAINGTGWGMSINRKTGDLWAGSFQDLSPAAFLGKGDPTQGFVSHFGPAPERQLIRVYNSSLNADIAGVQGVNSDKDGNVFFACLTTSKICRIDATSLEVECKGNDFIRNPFDVDTDSQGNVWVSDANSFEDAMLPNPNASYAIKLTNDLEFLLAVELPPPTEVDVFGQILPASSSRAVVVDKYDNAWVSVWRANAVVCLTSDGKQCPGSPYYVNGTWGISLDGDQNIWLAVFGDPKSDVGHSVIHMCGASSQSCSPGQLLSPADGWGRHGGAMQRLVDAQPAFSGAMVASNNWKRQPTPIFPGTNPGGNGMVIIPGLCSPPDRILG